MISNKVSYRFASEAYFEKFFFHSETITVKEIIEYLTQKKKLDQDKKTDRIALYNYDGDMKTEVNQNGIVDAGTRLIVVRKPDFQMNK
jgi:hypothetical protein